MKHAPVWVSAFLVLVLPTLVLAMTSTNYGISWDSINSGGLDVSTSTNYGLKDTIGEAATGNSTSSNYEISAGYRAGEGSNAYISFRIRNEGDTDDSSACNLGTLSQSSVSTCAYRLRIETNAQNGFTTYIRTSGGMISGTTTLANVGNDTSFTAGVEAYGLQSLTGASAGGVLGGVPSQPIVESSSAQDASLTFNADATPLNFTNTTSVLSYSGPFSPSVAPSLNTTSLFTHAATVASSTAIGTYTQTVTYRITGTF